MKQFYRLLTFFLPVLLTACGVASAKVGVEPAITPTDCGCSIEDLLAVTPTGGIGALPAVGPAAPASTPAPLESYRGQWQAYTDPKAGISFEYPAVYAGPDYSFCAPRDLKTPPNGVTQALNLGSRTSLTLRGAGGQDLQAAAEAYKSGLPDAAFDEPQQREVAGVPALVLPYRLGGSSRFATTALWIKDGTLYTLETGVPSACDVDAIDLREMHAFSRMLDTLTIP